MDAITHELITVTNDSYINAVSVCELLWKLRFLYPDLSLTLYFLLVLDMGVTGLAYANTAAFSLGFLLQLLFLQKKLPLQEGSGLFRESGKVLLSLIPAVSWVFLFRHLFGNLWWQEGSSWLNFAILALEGLIFTAILVLCFFLFRLKILSILRNRGTADEE
ncbi:MAG: polysaccharide biosynthesis C-terminal domain-containing protein [Sulfurovaceae bacterium]